MSDHPLRALGENPDGSPAMDLRAFTPLSGKARELINELYKLQGEQFDSNPASNMEQLRQKPAPITTIDLVAGCVPAGVLLLLYFMSDISRQEGEGNIGLLLVVFVMIALGYALFLRCRKQFIQLFLNHLESSGIAEKLANDPDFAFEFNTRLPALFGRTFFGASKRDLNTAVRTLSQNLDWFIRPPVHIFRWEWLLIPCYLLLVICQNLLFWLDVRPSSVLDMFVVSIFLFGLGYIYALVILWAALRRILGARALAAYLEERFKS